jgi:spore coat protein U-like protein
MMFSFRRSVPWLLLAPVFVAHATLSCSVAVGPLAFGTYSGAQVNSSTTMTIACSRDTNDKNWTVSYTAALSTGASGTFAQRKLTNSVSPADQLNYNMYLGSVPGILNTSVWGDTSGGTIQAVATLDLSPPVTSRSVAQTVAGAVAAGPVPGPGLYSDTIMVTLTYN